MPWGTQIPQGTGSNAETSSVGANGWLPRRWLALPFRQPSRFWLPVLFVLFVGAVARLGPGGGSSAADRHGESSVESSSSQAESTGRLGWFVAGTVFFSLLFGFAFARVAEGTDTLRSVEDAKRLFGVPVLGTVPVGRLRRTPRS